MDKNEIWNQWNSQHNLSDQIKRQERAKGKDLTPLSINPDNCSGTFLGRHGTYNTTLSSCNCVDFLRQKLPCKHMYRLAHELKVFSLSGNVLYEPHKDPTNLLDKNKAMEIIQNSLTKDEQIRFKDFCYRCGNDNAGEELFPGEFANKLISLELAIEVTEPKILLGYLHIQFIRKFLPPNTKSPRKKTELIELIAPLITKDDIVFPDNKKCVTLHPRIAHLGFTLHRKLCSLYPKEEESFFF